MAEATPPGSVSWRHLHSPAVFCATFGGSGLMKPAPGTWGSLAAALLAGALAWFQFPYFQIMMIALVPLLLGLGLWCIAALEKRFSVHDPGWIVIDEAAGCF